MILYASLEGNVLEYDVDPTYVAELGQCEPEIWGKQKPDA